MSKVLVDFARNKEHVGFFPTSSGIRKFESDPGDTNHSKGATQFLYEKGLPKGLFMPIARTRKVKRGLFIKRSASSKPIQSSQDLPNPHYDKILIAYEDKLIEYKCLFCNAGSFL